MQNVITGILCFAVGLAVGSYFHDPILAFSRKMIHWFG